MQNTIVIKIESGVVADVYSPGPLQVIVVDYDMIEGGETQERKTQKAVLSMSAEQIAKHDDLQAFVQTLVLGCRRPADDTPEKRPEKRIRAA